VRAPVPGEGNKGCSPFGDSTHSAWAEEGARSGAPPRKEPKGIQAAPAGNGAPLEPERGCTLTTTYRTAVQGMLNCTVRRWR
jgi:hypothetical protein